MSVNKYEPDIRYDVGGGRRCHVTYAAVNLHSTSWTNGDTNPGAANSLGLEQYKIAKFRECDRRDLNPSLWLGKPQS